MYNLKKILDEAITCAEQCNLPIDRTSISRVVGTNNRKNALGLCHHKYYRGIGNRFSISISVYCLQCDYETVRNTIAHEVVHCCDGCQNHGVTFKRYAEIMNKHGNYKIGTHATYEESIEFKSKVTYKYNVTCKSCGHSYGYSRMCKIIKYPERFRCGCGSLGKFKITQNY